MPQIRHCFTRPRELTTRSSGQKLLKLANLLLLNQSWSPLVLSDSRKLCLVLRLKARRIHDNLIRFEVICT